MSDNISFEEILTWPEMADVLEELNDPRFANRSHGGRGTYADKCHGPLCRIAEKEHGRRRNARRAARAGREMYEPKTPRKYDRDDLLLAIIQWHKEQIAIARIRARAS